MKRHWLSLLFSLLIFVALLKLVSTPIKATSSLIYPTHSSGTMIIAVWGLTLMGFISIMTFLKSIKATQTQIIKNQNNKLKAALYQAFHSKQPIRLFYSFLKSFLLKEDKSHAKKLERIFRVYQSSPQTNLIKELTENHVRQGDNFCLIGQYNKAIDSYQKALELNVGDCYILCKMGNAFSKKNQHVKAIFYYKKAINYQSHRAIDCCERLIELGHASAPIWFSLGYAYSQIGESVKAAENYKKAIKKCEQILSIDPNNYSALYDKARCYALQSDINLAISSLKVAIRLNSKCREAAKIDSEFDAIREDRRFQQLIED